MQLLNALRHIILSSADYAGSRLPSSRMLAAELSVSRTTVQAVYDQLISEGYLIGRQGSGTFIATEISHLTQPEPRASTVQPAVTHWRPFATGLPDLSLTPHQHWARHLERAWRQPDPALLARPDPLGWYPLRQAIADHLDVWRQLRCDPEQVVITSGSTEAFEAIVRSGLAAPGPVAIEDPCWPKLHSALVASGATVHPVRIDDQGLDAAKIPYGTATVIVTPSRHYPTGRSLPLPRRVALLDWATRNNGLIIEDDYDSEFRYQGHPLPSLSGLNDLQQTIYLGSFSKLMSPSIRIGYMVVPQRYLRLVRDYLDRAGPRASLVPQPALAGFMQSGEFAVHLRRMRRVYARRQAHLIDALTPVRDLLDVQPDPAGMHLCVPLTPALTARASDQQIAELARHAGLSISALSAHSVLPEKPQALLLGYAAFDEETLSNAAATLETLLRHL